MRNTQTNQIHHEEAEEMIGGMLESRTNECEDCGTELWAAREDETVCEDCAEWS